MAIILVYLAGIDEANDPPGGGASFETLVAIIFSVPIYFVLYPLTYLLIARFVPTSPTSAIPRRQHLVIFAAFAIGAFVLAMLAGMPNTLADPLRAARQALALVGIFTAQFIVYFELLENLRIRD